MKEYIKQGIGIYIGFLIATIGLSICLAVGFGIFSVSARVIQRTGEFVTSVKKNSTLRKEQEEIAKAEEARRAEIAKAEEIQRLGEEEALKAEIAKAEVYLTETATSEIVFEKDGKYTLKVKEGSGSIELIKDTGTSKWLNMKEGDDKTFEAKKGFKILLPPGMNVIWAESKAVD